MERICQECLQQLQVKMVHTTDHIYIHGEDERLALRHSGNITQGPDPFRAGGELVEIHDAAE